MRHGDKGALKQGLPPLVAHDPVIEGTFLKRLKEQALEDQLKKGYVLETILIEYFCVFSV